MKTSRRQKRKEDFKKFIDTCDCFDEQEKCSIDKTFHNKQIQVIFSLTMYLFLWSFLAAFIDTFLVTRGVVFAAIDNEGLAHFLPTAIFLLVNASLKFSFIYFYLRGRVHVRTWHIFVGVIPMIGSLFITAILLRRQKLFFRALKKYLTYRKKKRMEFITHLKLHGQKVPVVAKDVVMEKEPIE